MTVRILELVYTTVAILKMLVSGVNVSNYMSGFPLHCFTSVNVSL